MGLADGDLYVSGSILSFQQMKRIYQNFRAATVPSNLQAGALWSDSDDDRLWHQGTTLDEVFTEKTTLTWENLLSNSGFGVWSQSDASKGLATITYDSGGVTALVVGETLTGNTSGATCKVISYTTATGTWAGGDAAGIITVGACSHDFAWVDNETVTGSGAGADAFTVNMPDSAVQVGLLQNGGYAAATTGWTGTNCTLASVAGGQVGNCLQLTRTAGDVQFAYQNSATAFTIGKIYKASIYVKSGTSGDEAFGIGIGGSSGGGSPLQGRKEGTSTAAWVLHTLTFEATAVYMSIYYEKSTATAGTMLFDEGTCYEITPCCTAADALAFDGWGKDTTIDIYRQHNNGGTLTKDGSFYSLKIVNTAVSDFIKFTSTEYYPFIGRTVTVGMWVKTSTASHCRIRIYDGVDNSYSDYHTGGGAWEWLEVTRDIDASATNFIIYVYAEATPAVNGDTIVYVSQPMLVLGSHIGEGNYQPKPQEFIWMEKNIPSNVYDGLLNQSDLAYADLNLEADSDAMLPKEARVIAVLTDINDAGSGAGLDVHLELRKDAIADTFFINSVAGKPNDVHNHQSGFQPCDVNGDVDIHIDASGASTFDINEFEYHGVQVN